MKTKLFQYAVIWNPTKQQEEKGKKSKLIVEPTNKLSKDEKSLGLLVARKIPEKYIDELDQIEIVIRPF